MGLLIFTYNAPAGTGSLTPMLSPGVGYKFRILSVYADVVGTSTADSSVTVYLNGIGLTLLSVTSSSTSTTALGVSAPQGGYTQYEEFSTLYADDQVPIGINYTNNGSVTVVIRVEQVIA
jgi:hypothetical protein